MKRITGRLKRLIESIEFKIFVWRIGIELERELAKANEITRRGVNDGL